ncbi:hypothetical protein FOZ62_006633, partial [Perkinsus olseni]
HVSLPERNSTSRGVCRFTDFSSACSECRFAVEIMTTDWTYQFVGYQMEFAYSRIEEYWYPKEEPFRCCPTRETFDCCNFYTSETDFVTHGRVPSRRTKTLGSAPSQGLSLKSYTRELL